MRMLTHSNFRVSLHANIKPALAKLHNTISVITSQKSSDLRVIASRMDLIDLNKALYRCDQEERDETSNRFGVYDIPGYGPLAYAGFQGIFPPLTYMIHCMCQLANLCCRYHFLVS